LPEGFPELFRSADPDRRQRFRQGKTGANTGGQVVHDFRPQLAQIGLPSMAQAAHQQPGDGTREQREDDRDRKGSGQRHADQPHQERCENLEGDQLRRRDGGQPGLRKFLAEPVDPGMFARRAGSAGAALPDQQQADKSPHETPPNLPTLSGATYPSTAE